MSLAPDGRFGAYEVLSLIGSGGMGGSLPARDTKLDRDVAIKVLPDLFVADTERIARFQREARTLAAMIVSVEFEHAVFTGTIASPENM